MQCLSSTPPRTHSLQYLPKIEVSSALHHFRSSDSVASLLRRCRRTKNLIAGKIYHAHLTKLGLDSNILLSNHLIELYGVCGSFRDACFVFEHLSVRNNYSHNIMIKVYGCYGRTCEAKATFDTIQNPDIYSWTTLINAYGQNGCVEDAMSVFSKMPSRNVVSWTAMISTYAQNQYGREALDLFCRMQMEGIPANAVTFTCALDACAVAKDLEAGQRIHALMHIQACIMDVELGTSLLNMYGKCGSVCDARSCFADLPSKNIASWTAMITAAADFGSTVEVLSLLNQMQVDGTMPDHITFMYVIDSCAHMRALELGHIINAAVVEACCNCDAFIESALLSFYGRCGKVDDAQHVFNLSSRCDIVSWTSMIGMLTQNGEGRLALRYFERTCLEGICPDKVMLLTAMDACASLQIVEKSRQIHAIILDTTACDADHDMENSLLNIYGKSGCLHEAKAVFQSLTRRDICSWNTIIAACVQNGQEEEVWNLCNQMQSNGVDPDHITFICCLTACSHIGNIEKGKEIYLLMIKTYGSELNLDHHLCVIDLLGRGGHLHEAQCLAENILSGKAVLAWLSLLGACKVHGDGERGLEIANYCLELDPENTAPYVLLSNIRAEH